MFKKALVVLMAASALSFALTGCDKTETKTENAATEAKSEEAKSEEAKSEEAKEEKKEEKAEEKTEKATVSDLSESLKNLAKEQGSIDDTIILKQNREDS